jgi:hypothetical protein
VGGRGSGGRRIGAGRKRKSALERAISGTVARRGVVLHHPSSTAVAPVEPFDPPATLTAPPQLSALTAALELLQTACAPPSDIKEAQAKVDEVRALGLEALAVWHELAPSAFEARTLTPATSAAFTMLCRAVARERATEVPDADHRGLMQRVATWLKDFGLAPLGKPMYVAQPEAPANPLDRFTKGRA